VKFEELVQLDPDHIYDPANKSEHKTKPIFKVIRPQPQLKSRKSSLTSNSNSEQNFLSEIGRQADAQNLFSSAPDIHSNEFIMMGALPTTNVGESPNLFGSG